MPTHYQGTSKEKQALNTFIKLMRATNAIHTYHRPTLIDRSLTNSQFGVLEALLHLGPMCQQALAEKILKTGGNMTTVIDNLEKRDLVRRVRDENDRRFFTIELTKEGKALIEKVFPAHVEAIVSSMSPLNQSEQKQLESLLKKLGLGLTQKLS